MEPPPSEKTEKGEKGEKPKTREEMIDALIEEIRHLEVIRTKAEGRIESLKAAGSKRLISLFPFCIFKFTKSKKPEICLKSIVLKKTVFIQHLAVIFYLSS